MDFPKSLRVKTAIFLFITLFLSEAVAEFRTSQQSLYLQVRNSGSKYQKRTPNYVSFSGEDGTIVTSKDEAALFELAHDHLTSGNDSVALRSSSGFEVFQKSTTVPGGSWYINGDSIEYRSATQAERGESSHFCVSKDNTLFVELTSRPSFACKPVDLKPELVQDTTTSPTIELSAPASSTTATHQELKRDPARGGDGGGGRGGGSGGSRKGGSGNGGSGRGGSGNKASANGGYNHGGTGNGGNNHGSSANGDNGRGGRLQPTTTKPPTPDPSSDLDWRDVPAETPTATVDMRLVRRGGVVRATKK